MSSGPSLRPLRMRAARIVAPGRISIESVPVPRPAANQVRFRVEGCGVSRSAAWDGAPGSVVPSEAGRSEAEAWGIVEELGPQASAIRRGDRIAALSLHGFAEFDVVDSDCAIVLPKELGDAPFPGRLLGGAMNVFDRSRIVAGQVVAVVGIGFLGALLVKLATRAGAIVIAVSRRPFSLALAREMGAAAVVEVRTIDQTIAELTELTEGRLCHTVIEAAGQQPALTLASALVGPRGTLVIAGTHRDGKRELDLKLWNERGIDVINAHERDPEARTNGMRAALRYIETSQLDPSSLYTHVYGFERLGEALDAARTRPVGLIKAVLRP